MNKRIFVSNRLPFSVKANGDIERGSGGLVSALMSVDLESPFMWMGFETDSKHADVIRSKAHKTQANLKCHPVLITKELYNDYYDGFSNDVIWPLFHYEGQLATFHSEKWDAYVEANKLMAEAVAQNANPGDTVWIHDFHFLCLPQFIREYAPSLKIGFFLHIPFPSYELFRQLPVHGTVLKALLNCDLIGFHEHSYMYHFAFAVKSSLGLNTTMFKTSYEGRTVQLGVFPICINSEDFEHKRVSQAVYQRSQVLKSQLHDRFMILGIDRLDYTKGLDLKLLGFQRVLKKYPELIGKITLLQVAVPTRLKVPSYMRLKKDIDRLVGSINGEFAQAAYTPVQYIFNSISECELIALYNRADAALITSKRDGMNLVAMEYSAAQSPETPGVLILSEFAGAATLLTEALTINPWDPDAIADAIYRSYHMDLAEKKERMEKLKDVLSRYSPSKWAAGFLQKLETVQNLPKLNPSVLTANRIPVSLYRTLAEAPDLKIILDYDGTLVPIAKTPEEATLPAFRLELLQNLGEITQICILSGRPRKFLDEQFKNSSFLLAAEHGAFYKHSGNSWRRRISSDIDSWYDSALKIMVSYAERVPLSFVEKKESALVWHYRASPNFAEHQAKKLEEELQAGFANCPVIISKGKKIIELKAFECDKGNFVRWYTQNDGPETTYLCAGDDQTDEDMFAVMIEKGLTLKIGMGPSVAEFRLESPQEVYGLLEKILKIRQRFLLRQEKYEKESDLHDRV